MPAKTNKNPSRLMISLVGFVALIGAFVAFGLLPHFREVSRLEARIKDCDQQLSTAAAQSRELREHIKRKDFMCLEVRNYDRLVPGNQDLGPFLAQLSQELDNAGMKDITVRALAPTMLGKCQQLPIEIRGTGSFAQFHQFLVKLENLPRMSSVSKMMIESDAPMTGKVSVELTLSIYNTKPSM